MALTVLAAAAALTQLPGASAIKTCAAAGPYWPTMTLAVHGQVAWVACKEQSRVLRVDTATGRTTATIRLGGQPIAVTVGLGSVWALDSGGALYRIDAGRARIARRQTLPVRAAYNLWVGGGSVWTADDQGGAVVRVSPRGRIVAQPQSLGDGPADIVFHGNSAWVINHRNRTLAHIDLRTNRARRLAVLPGDAPERMVWSHGSLWVTGRGTDLLQVDPSTGRVVATVEIGASGIDVAVDGDDLIVPTRSDAVDASGFPTMDALKRVSALTREVTIVASPESRLDVHGIATARGAVWLADNTAGFIYRVPSS
jgi:DNA-binding beta-propeller fold protein YncE